MFRTWRRAVTLAWWRCVRGALGVWRSVFRPWRLSLADAGMRRLGTGGWASSNRFMAQPSGAIFILPAGKGVGSRRFGMSKLLWPRARRSLDFVLAVNCLAVAQALYFAMGTFRFQLFGPACPGQDGPMSSETVAEIFFGLCVGASLSRTCRHGLVWGGVGRSGVQRTAMEAGVGLGEHANALSTPISKTSTMKQTVCTVR